MPDGKPHAEMGVIIFNKAHKVMQYCNGDDWVGIWGGGSGSSVDLNNLNASNLTSGTVPKERLGTGTANNTTFLRGDGTWASVVDTPPTCTGSNNALQWNGTSWACVNIEGGGGMDLVNSQHSSAQCTGLGGTIVTDASNNKFCRFNQANCPAGWFAHQNWRTYASQTCGNSSQMCAFLSVSPPNCSTGVLAWGNNPTGPSCVWRIATFFANGMCGNPVTNNTCTSTTITQQGCY